MSVNYDSVTQRYTATLHGPGSADNLVAYGSSLAQVLPRLDQRAEREMRKLEVDI